MFKKLKQHKKLTVFLLIVIVVIAVGGYFVFARKNQPKDVDAGETGTPVVTLSKQDMTNSITTSGTVESANVTEVTTDAQMTVKELKVALGERVEKGQVLCTLDEKDIREQIAELEKADATAKQASDSAKQQAANVLAQAQADVQTKQAALADAQATYESIKKLVNAKDKDEAKKNVQALTDAQAAVAAAQAAVDEANQNVLAAQDGVNSANSATVDANSELKKLNQQLSQTTITAAQSGVITQLNVSNGSMANGTLMRIEDDSSLQVNIGVKEKDILKMAAGMKATITSDAIGKDKEFKGQVDKVINFTSTSVSSDGTTAASGYSATVTVEPGTPLLLGMTVKVNILLNEAGDELAVPYDAIVTEGDSSYVFKAADAKDGKYKVQKVSVTVGDANDYYTAISGEGLEEGDYIVWDPTSVSEGDEIDISDVSDMDQTLDTEVEE